MTNRSIIAICSVLLFLPMAALSMQTDHIAVTIVSLVLGFFGIMAALGSETE